MEWDKFFSVFGKIAAVLIVLAIVAFGAYYFGIKQNKSASVQTPTSNTIAEATPTPTSLPLPTVDETQALISDVKNGLITEHGSNAASLTISISKIEGDYAKGAANEEHGGGMWFAAKVNGVWKLVWDGNGIIKCSDLIQYPNFPKDMIPECFDDKTQNMVTR